MEEQRRQQEEERRREREEEEALLLARKQSQLQRDLASPANVSTPSPGSDSQGSSQPLTDESRDAMRARERERRRREAVRRLNQICQIFHFLCFKLIVYIFIF